MNKKNMFEVAAREKIRFPYKGAISVEDLWDLNAEMLDGIFKTLNTKAKQSKEESLLNKRTVEDEVLDTQIEIVKYIVGVKLTEDEARKQAKTKREQKQKIMSIISEKQDADLQNKSVEELQAMLGTLDA